MIAVDTSALMAILLNEPDAEEIGRLLFGAADSVLAAPTALEFSMVAHGHRFRLETAPQELLARPRLRIVPWTAEHVLIAQDAFRRYGKGQGHPAQLNFGDCMSYALARALDVPLLFKGGDFALTDVRPALAPGG